MISILVRCRVVLCTIQALCLLSKSQKSRRSDLPVSLRAFHFMLHSIHVSSMQSQETRDLVCDLRFSCYKSYIGTISTLPYVVPGAASEMRLNELRSH